MGRTLREKLATFDPERRERIEAEADRLHAEYMKRPRSTKEPAPRRLFTQGVAKPGR